MKTNYPGIDYGCGKANIGSKGIRYGIISQNDVDMEVADCIWQSGRDLDYEEYIARMKDNLHRALEDYFVGVNEETIKDLETDLRAALSDYFSSSTWRTESSELDQVVQVIQDSLNDNCECDLDQVVQVIQDSLNDNYECDCPSMLWEEEGYAIQTDSHGDLWILKSPYYTHAQFCSPCAPGACYLTSPLETPNNNNRAYCLHHDWFENEIAPYPVYNVANDTLVEPAVVT